MLPNPAAFLCAARWRLAGLGLVAAGLASSCSGAHEPTQQTEYAGRHPVRPTLNVPTLLGQSIEGLQQRLGSTAPLPTTYEDGNAYAQLAPNATDSVRTFRTGGLLLVASYDVHSRRVHDLLLLGRHEDSLMHQATLRPNASGYLVLPVFRANHPGSLLGLRIVDTNSSRN